MAYRCYNIPCYQLFSFLKSGFLRRTFRLDIISSQINDMKPILFCLNYGELLQPSVLKFKYILLSIFPFKWPCERSVYSHELKYFIDELGDELMSVYNSINACCLTKQSRNLVGPIKSIFENVILVLSFFVASVFANSSYAAQFQTYFDEDIFFVITAC